MIYLHLIMEMVKALLKDYPDLVTGKENAGFTPLHMAAQMGHKKDIVELLRQHGGHK